VSLSPNIAGSKITIAQRWQKLYRTIYHTFLKSDFTHKDDYAQDLAQLNARVTELETKITTELTKIQIGLSTHIHTAPQAPAGALPTTPPPAPPYTSGFSPTKPVIHKDTFLEQKDALLQATGPALAPLGDGISPEAQIASLQSKQDIGLS